MARGLKTGGGSRKGRPNKATVFQQQELWALIHAREREGRGAANPYVFLLDLMTDEAADMSHRLQAATFLGARLLPSLKAIDATVQGQVDVVYYVDLWADPSPVANGHHHGPGTTPHPERTDAPWPEA